MNYEPNTVKWKPGDIVLHDADAKCREMLMYVMGYTKDGLCRTRYVDSDRIFGGGWRVWENPIEYLHDPIRFGIEP